MKPTQAQQRTASMNLGLFPCRYRYRDIDIAYDTPSKLLRAITKHQKQQHFIIDIESFRPRVVRDLHFSSVKEIIDSIIFVRASELVNYEVE
jgi:hypothetical protein